MSLKERERHLVDEVNMRRMLDAYTQRQLYQLVKAEQELKRINRIQHDELAKLSAALRRSESMQSDTGLTGARFAPEMVILLAYLIY